MSWDIPNPGPARLSASIPGIDASLVLAESTSWRDFTRDGEPAPDVVPVIAEVRKDCLPSLRDAADVPSVYVDDGKSPCIVTATVAPDKIGQLIAEGGPVKRLELQAAYLPRRPQPRVAGTITARTAGSPQSSTPVLIGVIDQGCPFAHADLRRSGGGTRVLSLWLQDEHHADATRRNGTVPALFGRGLQLTRGRLDELMQRFSDADGRIDEPKCYEAAGLTELRNAVVHGAGVLSLVAGSRPAMTRMEPPKANGSTPIWGPPQRFQRIDDMASRSDIVFVQPPRDALQDSSSGSLGRYVLDGLAYIVSCAGPETRRIVVNISDGSSRGPHDGTWMVTRGIEAMVASERTRGRELCIVVAAGNSADEERHAQIDRLAPRDPAGVTLRVQPGCEMPTQVVVRIPAAATGLRMRITPPHTVSDGTHAGVVGAGEALCWPSASKPECVVVFPNAAPGAASIEALVSWAPTERQAPDMPRAMAGNWRIEFESPRACEDPIHLFIPRSQTNPGALQRGRQAVFVDVSPGGDYDPRRWLRAASEDPTPALSPIRRAGTLNALATGHANSGIEVVGAKFAREGTRTSYSSLGPTVQLPGANKPSRQYPDCLRPADNARAVRGVAVGGSTSGQIVRVTGTSFAAPQRAREIVNM